jgi:glucose-1-phosphate adenylyltransferase
MPLHDVLALILGGGAGTRLYPLTRLRAKPAVPIAGNYRLVDVPISNCLNSGIEHIYILTQFNSVSLHRHITQTYKFDLFSRGWVQILAAEQTPRSSDWYQGTADAVRKQRPELEAVAPNDFLILSGDHLYRMDYEAFVRAHRENQADITVAVLPVAREEARRFGIVQTDPDGRIVKFHEKPSDPAVLDTLATYPDPERPFLGSMGVYVFRAAALYELLDGDTGSDFGKHILPNHLNDCRVMAYPFDDYWEDIGTIRAFYQANLALVQPDARFSFYDSERPIFTHPRFLPPTQVGEDCLLDRVMLAAGGRVIKSQIYESVIGIRSQIGPGARIARTIMMGSDFYQSAAVQAEKRRRGEPLMGVGAGCVIEGAIIDKNACIGDGVVIRQLPNRPDVDTEAYAIRDGIVIVAKNASIPAGTVI